MFQDELTAREEAWRDMIDEEIAEAMQSARLKAARDFAELMRRYRMEFADREERG